LYCILSYEAKALIYLPELVQFQLTEQQINGTEDC